jgi:phage/plasmid-like protein (TIGR03299 family)
MAHLIENMAFVRETPWHGLGNRLPDKQPLEVWLEAAGMDWEIKTTDVLFRVGMGNNFNVHPNPDAKVLYRSDTLKALSVVSPRYKVVQPKEILEFYRDLVSIGGFELETAGVLKDGKKLWALAKTGEETVLKGGDRVKGYLLLATSCDGTLATTAQFTSVRVVCNNTLQIATDDRVGAIKVPHSTKFDPMAVKQALGVGASAWEAFEEKAQVLAGRKVNRMDVTKYIIDVLGDRNAPIAEQPNEKALKTVVDLFAGKGKGSNLASSEGTAWGLVNAVTEYVDHHRRARSQDYRLDSAWFGQGAGIKEKAWMEALKLVA